MATFQYEALNTVGQTVKGQVDAANSEEAAAKVRAMGNFPTKIKERATKRRGRGQAGAQRRGPQMRKVGHVPIKQLTTFTRQLSTLIDAGLPILRSLRILEQQQKPGPLRVAIRLVAEDVESGVTLSDAMARHEKAFNALYTNMIRAGEVGGVLDVILNRLADFLEKGQALKRKVIGALIYPAAVIGFAVLIVTGIMMFVIPAFKKIFSDMGRKLPAMTQSLIDLSDWMKAGGWLAVIAAPLALIALSKLLRMSPTGRLFIDRMKFSIPVLGKLISKSGVERFCRTLGTLLSAGVPILEALNITRETAGNEVFARALGKVRDAIREGESFADPLRQSKILEPMVVN
ncbi:MAG: type II secretion system F family protein, partial [Planctomycetes bacterium]|nr:type II secretion system F family protein [Planctomycetota bacterium]